MSHHRLSGSPRARRATGRIAVLLGALLSLSSVAIAPSHAAVPTLATDKADYRPEETVHITGTGYEPGAEYDVPVMRPDGSMVRGDASGLPGWDHVTADESGNLAYDYVLDGIFGVYQVRVYASSWSGDWNEAPLAAVTFTDAANLDQCANDIPGVTPPCAWQNGNINGNNSSYAEGDVVPFRLRVTDLDTSLTAHTIHLNYDFTQAGHKAYDFLATYNATEVVDICGPGGGGPPHPLCANLPAPNTAPFPSDPLVVDGLSVAGAEAAFEASGATHTRLLTIWGGSIVSITPVSGPVHSGDFENGNSTADFLVTFTSTSDAVILAWGGHIASSAYWNVANGGAPDGAGQINGSPWHMRTQSLDGSGLSNEDRSIQVSALIPGSSITVVKNTVPDNAQDFVFVPSAGVNGGISFVLDDDGPAGSATPNTLTFPVDAGTHTVTESLPVAGFDLDSITCVDPTGGSAGNPDTGVATFDVALGENVTCTFHNVELAAPAPGRIIVEKVVIGTPDGTDFPFISDLDGDITNGADFALMAGQSFDSGPLVAGTFAVAEVVPDGWSLVRATCSDGSPVDAIVLGVGETVTCTFTDEALPAAPGYDTYDDDAGDAAFDFDTPFDDAAADPGGTGGDAPGTDVAGVDLSAGAPAAAPSPVADAAAMADFGGSGQSGVTVSDPGLTVDPAVLPQALSHLPRTGTAAGQMVGLGFLLMATGVVLLLLRPRRQDEYSS